ATSEMYASKQSALKGIASVQKNGSSETIKDLTV
ncbi:YegP family protein, partial [Providencia sp.]